MKIKVVDMPYEQALAQPREKHTPPRRPFMLFRALLRALSAPDLRATHFRCDRVGMERLGPDEPCLVLMNHSCFLDLRSLRRCSTRAPSTSSARRTALWARRD